MHGTVSACDYLILGAGSAGCVLANRLSENAAAQVLLLEAGGPDDNPDIHDPQGVFVVRKGPEDWAYVTMPQRHCNQRQIDWPRGRVLGGSSSINAMIYIRGHPADYDAWAYLGNAGWDFDRVLPYFRKSEDFDGGESQWHGVGGPLHVLSRYEPHPWHSAFVEAATEVGYPYTHDFNATQMAGVGFCHLTVKNGKRHSTAEAFLAPASGRPNLHIATGARARRLLFQGARCVGVEYVQDGQFKEARANLQVIVSEGTIESPRLLMLSGIGPADDLRRRGIGVIGDLPGVGENLHDHTLVPLIYSSSRPMPPPVPGLQPLHGQLFWYTDERLPAPDLQPVCFHLPMYVAEVPEHGYTFGVGHVRPVSRGTLKLSAADPDAPLLIDPNYLAEPHDVQALEIGFEICRTIGAASSLADWRGKELYPGETVRGKKLQDYIRNTVRSYHHQVGTCKMGIDSLAVVDPELRVYGVDGLRVVDASIMPAVVSGNTNAPVIMIAEKARRHDQSGGWDGGLITLEARPVINSFAAELWASNSSIYAAILRHPFIAGLTDATLPDAIFRYYVIQDALYLRDFARALAVASAKSPEDPWCEMFAEHARIALVVERSLHEGFFRDWGLSPEQLQTAPASPTTLAYASYLLRVAYAAPFAELVGAVLPCYWIYWEVGKHLERAGSPNPLYQRWIGTYASEEFGAAVKQVVAVLDQCVGGSDPAGARRARIRQHFLTTSRYEWMFWDAAWRQETWPVGGD